ncbi:hypothetical protein BB561_002088 [Smittium simulii]|uniref:Uncharacterized protein n=1 Tax=Smittium simulii TaxID=133385 RepID=A0A2T9YRU0_9FUNG|nr:hypothetical protein BB561_002088 [Smittium simulii]
MLLLGEELKLSSTRIRKDPTVLCVKTTLATAKFLNAIALPRYLMLNSIRLAPIPPNQCPPEAKNKSTKVEYLKPKNKDYSILESNKISSKVNNFYISIYSKLNTTLDLQKRPIGSIDNQLTT